MPQGLQAWDASSVLTVDITDRLTRIIGSVRVTAPGSMTVAEFSQGTPFVIALPERSVLANGIQPNGNALRATVSGTTLSWNSAGGGATVYVPTNILFGVY